MSATHPCPPVRDLHRLGHGQTDEREAGPLKDHLEQCARCREIVSVLQLGPDAAATPPALDAAAGDDGSGTWQGGLRPARASSASVRRPTLAGSRPVPTVPAAPPPARPTDSTEEAIARLAPPESPEELGRLGGYRLLHVLGSGATGVVFLAEDLQLQRRVALKVMKEAAGVDDPARQRFLREARSAAVIDHDHIVTIYQVGEDRGALFLAMKLLQGETLDERLKREGQLLVHEVLRIGREIAEGLDAAHEHGLVHRDIKPANLFLEAGTGRVKIVDFGLVRGAAEELQLTRTGTVVGTPAYMSPEQARGSRVDHRSDLFSLGCVLYRMCTGRTPFQADDTMAMLCALAQDQPPPIHAFNPVVPGPLVSLILRLLAKPPEARPQSARAVAASLAALEEAVAEASGSGQLHVRTGSRAARPRWQTAVQMLALAALGGALYWCGPPAARVVRDYLLDVCENSFHGADRR